MLRGINGNMMQLMIESEHSSIRRFLGCRLQVLCQHVHVQEKGIPFTAAEGVGDRLILLVQENTTVEEVLQREGVPRDMLE